MTQNHPTFILILISLIIILTNSSTCSRQRCCLVSPCTSNHCQTVSSQTWVSSSSFANFGYTKLVLSNNSCLPCPSNCQLCSSQTVCTTCSKGYYMSQDQCKICGYNCNTCQVSNSISKCTSCSGSTYLDSTGQCKSCPNGANTCSSPTLISQCKTGFILTSNSMFCLSCPTNCNSCPVSQKICTSCATGYYLISGGCSACTKSNCTACSIIAGNQICTACLSGYFLSFGSCLSCSSNCQTCTSASVCTRCLPLFFLSSGTCQSSTPITRCSIYSSSSTCSSCQPSYYLSSSLCHSCSILCSTCTGMHFGTCSSCTSKATLFNRMCLPLIYTSISQYQIYQSYPGSALSGGTADCNRFLYRGSSITLKLDYINAASIGLEWRIFSINQPNNYTVSLTNTYGTQSSNFTTDTQTLNLCNTSSQNYHLSIRSHTLTNLKLQNNLTFSSATLLAFQQILIKVTMCTSLCSQCNATVCSRCKLDNLYTQENVCVYSCSSGYYIHQTNTSKSCVQLCPWGSYPLASNLTCQSCPYPCLSCASSIKCLSCHIGFYLTDEYTCTSSCPSRQYGSNLTLTCQPCLGRCRQCLSQRQCLSCLVGFYQQSTLSCVDVCSNSTQYPDLITLKCQTCSSTCLTCQGLANRCTSCPNGLNLYNYTCLGTCPNNYYAGNSSCHACQYPCQLCYATSTNCSSCIDRYFLNNTCLSNCPKGYFQDNTLLACTVCQVGCNQCAGNKQYCTSCIDGYLLYQNNCQTACPDRFYATTTNKICLSCQGNCHTCLNSSYCLTCSANFMKNGRCVSSSQCGHGYYADISTLSCMVCSSLCGQCQYKPTTCTSCNSSSSLRYLHEGQCLSSCGIWSYGLQINSIMICVSCVSPCQTCLNSSYCLSCIQGYSYSSGLCSTSCLPAHYFSSKCQSCMEYCNICTSLALCQLCTTNYFISTINNTHNQCVQQCPTMYYQNGLVGACQKCVFPCKQCQNSIFCISCQQGALFQGRCLSFCPDTTYLNSTTSICLPCSSNCLTCTSLSQCSSCNKGLFFYSVNSTCVLTCPLGSFAQNVTQMCLQCSSSCSSCINSMHCTGCIPQRTYLYQSSCLTICPLGFYQNIANWTCMACSSPCRTCTLYSTNCRSCLSPYLRVRTSVSTFSCISSCNPGYYTSSSSCSPCIFPCNTCNSSSTCLTCVDGTYLHISTSTCLLSCPSQTYLNNNTCISCTHPCDSCKNMNYCLSCRNGLYLHQGACLSQCPMYYYSDSTQLCLKCSGFCSTCSSKFYCLSCLTGYLSNGYCYSTCPAGTYVDLNTSKCTPCQTPCIQCVFNPSYCTRCSGGLFQYQGSCYSQCPLGSYLSGTSCIACSFPCTNCSSATTCYQCLGGYLLYNSLVCIDDVQYCPNDFYKMDGKFCIPGSQCPLTYVTDTDMRTCSPTCPSHKYRNNQDKTCTTQCKQDQYVSTGMVCTNYSTPPLSLMGMQVISFVKSSVINLVIVFNQSQTWLVASTDLYSIKFTDHRLLTQSVAYTLNSNNPKHILLRVTPLQSKISITLPAHKLKSSLTGYPLQNPSIQVKLPQFIPYQYGSIYQGYTARQFGQGIGWFVLLLTVFFIFGNRVSHLYVLWDTIQLLFVLIFLDIQYPPTLNQFLIGLSTTLFMSFPSMFQAPQARMVSDRPFYAYSYDCSFFRNAGPSLTILIVVLAIYLICKVLQWMMRHIQCFGAFMSAYPKIKKLLYSLLLRYRWHYISDVMFLTYLPIYLFALAQLQQSSVNPSQWVSTSLAVAVMCVCLLWPLFIFWKLMRHFPNISKGKHSQNLRCFYRGIQKTNKFGVFLILIRYFRKIIYCVSISIFSLSPMYALPLLTFSSLLMALFIFVKLPYKKRLSNVVQMVTQLAMVAVFMGIAGIGFSNAEGNRELNIVVGYICTGLLVIVLLLLVFQIFSKTLFNLQSQAQIRKRKQTLLLQGDLTQSQLRKKAGQFFDFMFPRIRKQFGFSQDSDEQEGEQQDSDNSENNGERKREWGLEQEERESEEFRHWDNNSGGEETTNKEVPKYMVRCVKQIQ